MIKSPLNHEHKNDLHYEARYQYSISDVDREALFVKYFQGIRIKHRSEFNETEEKALLRVVDFFDEFNRKPFFIAKLDILRKVVESDVFGKGVNVERVNRRHFDVLIQGLSQYLVVIEYVKISDDSMDMLDKVSAFYSNQMNMRIINILYHAGQATKGDIVPILENYTAGSIGVTMDRGFKIGIFSARVIWKQIRDYFIHPSVRVDCDALYALIKDSEVLTADRARYDEIKASGLLPSDIEKNFGKTI